MAIESINPATGRLLQRVEPMTDDVVRGRIATAATACLTMQSTPMEHRALWLRKLASLLEQEADDLAATATSEMGQPIKFTRQEVLRSAEACRFYADHAARMLAPEPISSEGSHSYLQWKPMGVVLAIFSADCPIWHVMRFAAPTLMGGNVCLVKHVGHLSRTALALEAIIRRAGFPRGSYQTLLIEPHQVERVLGDPRVAAVTLTGNQAGGRAVAAQAGWLAKKAVLSLSGSEPFVVRPSADLERAVASAVASSFLSPGPLSIPARRLLIATEIYDGFLRHFVTLVRGLVVGDPMQPSTRVGPVATRAQLDTLQTQIERARMAGARVITGGMRLATDGFYLEPTLLADVPRSCPVYREEIVGPLVLISRTSSLSESIAQANDSPCGQGVSAWTRDPAEQQQLLSELNCDTILLNQNVPRDHSSSQGTLRSQTHGGEPSASALRTFLTSKTVVIAAPPPRRK